MQSFQGVSPAVLNELTSWNKNLKRFVLVRWHMHTTYDQSIYICRHSQSLNTSTPGHLFGSFLIDILYVCAAISLLFQDNKVLRQQLKEVEHEAKLLRAKVSQVHPMGSYAI